MRGKKTDPAFIAAFIQESVALGHETPEQISSRAQQVIQEIDDKIREAERLKTIRSKLLDVIATFKAEAKDKSSEARLLSFFKIEHPQICKHLCELVKKQPLLIHTSGVVTADTTYAIKQLLECKVLARLGDKLIRGDRFDDYMTFVLREG